MASVRANLVRRCAVPAIVSAAVLAGCGTPPLNEETRPAAIADSAVPQCRAAFELAGGKLPLFSTADVADTLPPGWQSWTVHPNKTPTKYALAMVDRQTVLHARADSSASGLYAPLTAREARTLRWAWKTRDVIADADNAKGAREDAPLRLFVAFDGDKSQLPLKDQLMDEMARIITGREMPYATLMYIWGAKRAPGTILSNPHTDRIRMIVVDSGKEHANQWRCHQRDLRADYRRAFGKDPGTMVAIGVMTDTDNTKSRAEAWYGDITLD